MILLKWIVVYLTDKSQCIEVEGFLSPSVLSGVPKCACYLVFIIDGHMSLYADDLLLYRPIQPPLDNQGLQENIDTLSYWISAQATIEL